MSIHRLWPLVFVLLLVLALSCTRGGNTSVTPTPEGQVQRGERLYAANCQGCHGDATGGSMMDIPPRHNTNGHTWHHPDCQITETVLNGSGAMGEMMRQMMGAGENVPRMPAFKGALTQEEVQAILAYIKTWWTENQRQFQARTTQGACPT